MQSGWNIRAAVLLLVGLSLQAYGWGGRLHMDISRAAAQGVPDEMAGWRDYAEVLARHSINPDLWKEHDRTEGPRHYLDAERYHGLAITNLPADYAQVQPLVTRRLRRSDGIGPWVVMDVQDRLTRAMASNNWVMAARLAAALSHYVGDLHQPLHTTENFDEAGLHLRWEVNMPRYFWHSSLLKAGPAEYLADPWSSLLSWVADAHARYPEIYEGERVAVQRSADVESLDYYRGMWEATRDMFAEQTSKSATHLASLWYTAWVDAGRPTIPPPDEIPEGSFWGEEEEEMMAAQRDLSAWYFLGGLVVLGVVVIALSLHRGRSGHHKGRTVVEWKDD
ncbi:MAG: zinc dependent phospholipase C family protein [Kiritimatiellae bacterium]|nr:zinc dependent phospholipase C family protein [Kiritimatiellia bacterium]